MLVYGKCECFVMQMLYVCVLCASCCSSQCCMTCSLLMLVEHARGAIWHLIVHLYHYKHKFHSLCFNLIIVISLKNCDLIH